MSPIIGIIDSSKAVNVVTQAYESIATYTGSSQSTITFSSIPQTYKHLQLRMSTRSTSSNAYNAWFRWTINGVSTGGQYTEAYLAGNGSSISTYTSGTPTNDFESMYNPGSDSDSNVFGLYIVDFYDYANTSRYKIVNSYNGVMGNASTTRLGLNTIGGYFNSTSAVSSITLSSNYGVWASGSKFALYGIKG
jgi:hypothetical protein